MEKATVNTQEIIMAKFYCFGCREFIDFDKLFNDYEDYGYCTKCKCNIKGEKIVNEVRRTYGSKPVDCAPTCENVTSCEHSCVGYVPK